MAALPVCRVQVLQQPMQAVTHIPLIHSLKTLPQIHRARVLLRTPLPVAQGREAQPQPQLEPHLAPLLPSLAQNLRPLLLLRCRRQRSRSEK